MENPYPEDLKINQEDLQEIKFLLADCSLKEAKKRYCSDEDLFVVDIGKIIKDLGYDINSATDWKSLLDTKIASLYKVGVNPDQNQFWPIWQTFIDGSGGKLTN